MNPASATPETEVVTAFEPVLGWPWVAGLGLALVALAVWLARREAGIAGRRGWVATLLLLRLGAIAVLLWMLAGPTRVEVRKEVRPKHVALVVDRSASMGLVDGPDGSGNVSRWAAAREVGPRAASLRAMDGALAALRMAGLRLRPDGHSGDVAGGSGGDRGAALGRVIDGIERAVATLRTEGPGWAGPAGPGGDRRRQLADLLRSVEEEVLPAVRARLGGPERDREAGFGDLAADLAESTTALERWFEDRVREAEAAGAAGAGGGIPESEARESRWDKVEAFFARAEEGWLGELRRKAVVHRYEFGDRVVPLGAARWEGPGGRQGGAAVLAPATGLGAALQQVALDASGQPLEVAVVVTDGGQNAGRDPREVAPALAGTTLCLVPAGNTRMQRDVILHHAHAPTAVMLHDQVVVDALVTAYECDGEKLQVELTEDGVVRDRQTLEVRGAVSDQRVELRWKAAPLGRRKLGMRVVPVARERTDSNNSAEIEVQVLEDRIRVLVADQFPRWETRYLLNLFKRDERMEFESLLFEPQPAAGAGTVSAFPERPADWARYRVVILGDVAPAQLPPDRQKQLVDYVTRGGGNLILVAGREAMPAAYAAQPLGALLPVEKADRGTAGPFYLHLADEGTSSLATQVADTREASERAWREMTERLPLHGLSEFSKPRRSAHALLWAGPDRQRFSATDPRARSFLTWHYVGEGRVVYLAAPVSYQLRYRQGDRFHHRFWGQLLRWTVARDLAEGSRTVRLSTDRARYEEGDGVVARVLLSRPDGQPVGGARVTVAAEHEGRVVREIPLEEDPDRPGAYRGSFGGLPVGTIRLEAGGAGVRALLAEEGYRRPVETPVTIDPNGQLELRHPLCHSALLRETADAAGGLVLPVSGLETALRGLDLEPAVLEHRSKSPLWNRWDLLWIFITCLSLEWAGRKYLGLS